MEFAIQINHKDRVYVSGEISKPTGGVIADTTEEISKTGIFGGMKQLITGCLKAVTDSEGETVVERREIEPIVRNMPIHLAEIIALRALTLVNTEGIEQIVQCPRCKKERIYDEEECIEYDDLEIVPFEGEQIIDINLEDTVEIRSKDKVLVSASCLQLRFPTMNDGISGSMKFPQSKDVRRQYAIYTAALQTVNNQEVDFKFRNMWGQKIFERMYTTDLEEISKILSGIGIKKTIERSCVCGKSWDHPIDVSDFFALGLQSEG